MATRMELAPSGYTSPPSPYATSGYDPTQAAAPMRALAGGTSRPLTPSIVEYTPPEYSEEQVQAYQQEALAPALGALRRSMREMHAGRYASPSARREALRGATRGYGEALAPLQVGAAAQARQRYDIQYQQAIRAEELRIAEAMRAREKEEREILMEEATRPEYVSRHRAFQLPAPETGGGEVIGLGEASRRPISTAPGIINPYAEERISHIGPEPAYPENWMT